MKHRFSLLHQFLLLMLGETHLNVHLEVFFQDAYCSLWASYKQSRFQSMILCRKTYTLEYIIMGFTSDDNTDVTGNAIALI